MSDEKAELNKLQGQDFANYLSELKLSKLRSYSSESLKKLKEILVDCAKNGESYHLVRPGDFPELNKCGDEKDGKAKVLLDSLKPLKWTLECETNHNCSTNTSCHLYGCPLDYHKHDVNCARFGCPEISDFAFVGWGINF
jgi:hypothetical protein